MNWGNKIKLDNPNTISNSIKSSQPSERNTNHLTIKKTSSIHNTTTIFKQHQSHHSFFRINPIETRSKFKGNNKNKFSSMSKLVLIQIILAEVLFNNRHLSLNKPRKCNEIEIKALQQIVKPISSNKRN